MQHETKGQISAKEQAYIRMTELHFQQFAALLHDIGQTEMGNQLGSRELSIAYTKLEEAFFHTREFLLRQAAKRAALPN